MLKLGILGGGQLGRMLLQQAANYPVETWVMENDADCPAATLCHHFVRGDIRDHAAVLDFGRQVDVLTIEIENVCLEALQVLSDEGKRVFPNTHALRIIKNKILQKQFYASHDIPTAPFRILSDRAALIAASDFLPAVQKLATGGYDGRGVIILKSPDALADGFDAPSVLEKLIPIHKEIAIIVAIAADGSHSLFPAVEMVFDPVLNLLDRQLCPADIPVAVLARAESIALSVARNLASPGLFAVELLLDDAGNVYVNETAPRVHNSGHHSIEGNFCSQFDMLLRIILGYPPGNPGIIMPSVMLNLIGENGYRGEPVYEGLHDVLKLGNAYVHVYGKRETRGGRKMGHVTLLGDGSEELHRTADIVKNTLKVKGSTEER
jgi:5-(carboxyamino)imidazole ribonucleotide synthase